MRLVCARSRAVLRARIADERPVPRSVRIHVRRCLGCAAADARERRLVRHMRELASRVEPVPVDLEHRAMVAIGAPYEEGVRRGSEWVWKPAALAAAVAVGVVVARRRLTAPV